MWHSEVTGHICLSRSRLGTKLSVCAFVHSFIGLSYERMPGPLLALFRRQTICDQQVEGREAVSALQTQGRRPNPARCQQDSEDQDFAKWGKATAVVARALRDA